MTEAHRGEGGIDRDVDDARVVTTDDDFQLERRRGGKERRARREREKGRKGKVKKDSDLLLAGDRKSVV